MPNKALAGNDARCSHCGGGGGGTGRVPIPPEEILAAQLAENMTFACQKYLDDRERSKQTVKTLICQKRWLPSVRHLTQDSQVKHSGGDEFSGKYS